MISNPIYQNGRYKVVPQVVSLKVVDNKGRTLQEFRPSEVELAVETVDEMAERDGVLCHVA